MCRNWMRVGVGSTLAVVLALGSMFTPVDRLGAAQPSQGVEFEAGDKNVTVCEGVSGLTITIVEDADGNKEETVVRVANPKELNMDSEAHQCFLRYENIRKQMREEYSKRQRANRSTGNSEMPLGLREAIAMQDPMMARIMSGQPPFMGRSGGQMSGTPGGGGGLIMEGYTHDGKDVCVSEGDRVIVIVIEQTVKGKKKKTVIRAANAEKLAEKNPEAYCYHLWYKRDTSHIRQNVWSGTSSSSGSQPIRPRGR